MENTKITGIDLVKQALKRNARGEMIASFVWLPIVGFIYFYAFYKISSIQDFNQIFLFIFFVIVSAVVIIRFVIKKVDKFINIENCEYLKTLVYTPQEIVWLYGHTITTSSYSIQINKFDKIVLGFKDKKSIMLYPEKDMFDDTWEYLQNALPHAFKGYDFDVEAEFKKDPQRLLEMAKEQKLTEGN